MTNDDKKSCWFVVGIVSFIWIIVLSQINFSSDIPLEDFQEMKYQYESDIENRDDCIASLKGEIEELEQRLDDIESDSSSVLPAFDWHSSYDELIDIMEEINQTSSISGSIFMCP